MAVTFKEYKYSNILGWSSSRYDLFSRCKRAYFFNYYGKFAKDIPLNRIKELKFLTSVPLEIGNIIHHVIEEFLKRLIKSNSPIDTEKFIKFGLDKCDTYFDEKNFIEEYYKYTDKVDINYAKKRVEESLRNFMSSDVYTWIITEAIKSKDEWLIEPNGFGETRIDGLKAYCKMDFLFPVNNKVYILDWKSGKEHIEKHTNQLIGYALATQDNNPHISTEEIEPRIIYINPEVSSFKVDLDEDSLSNYKQIVKNQSDEMKNFCSDVDNNVPVSIDNFTAVNNENICYHCQYQEICVRG